MAPKQSSSNYDPQSKPTHSKSDSSTNVFAKLMAFALMLHDEYYFFIQKACSPICQAIPREVMGYTVWSANSVTYGRTLLVFVIAACMRFHYNKSAAFLVMYHDFLDHVDGVVAKVQRQDGRASKDDPVWGAFLDAFCDKIVFGTCLWSILLLISYEDVDSIVISTIVAVPSLLLLLYEVAIGVVRVNDYFHVSLVPPTKDKPKRELRAVMEGKLKQKFESIGVALLALSLPVPSAYPITTTIAVSCLIGGIYMAHKSLMHKLSAYDNINLGWLTKNVSPPE